MINIIQTSCWRSWRYCLLKTSLHSFSGLIEGTSFFIFFQSLTFCFISGEALLVSSGLVLYFGDILGHTLSKVDSFLLKLTVGFLLFMFGEICENVLTNYLTFYDNLTDWFFLLIIEIKFQRVWKSKWNSHSYSGKVL